MRFAQRPTRLCRTLLLLRLLPTLRRARLSRPARRPIARRALQTRLCRPLRQARRAATLRTRRWTACSRSPSRSNSKRSTNEERRGAIRGVFFFCVLENAVQTNDEPRRLAQKTGWEDEAVDGAGEN